MFYHIMTFGCQMNVHDSEKMAGYLERMGYQPTPKPEQAELLLVNTCSVREKADQKAYSLLGTLRKLKQENPERILIFCGCTAQLEGRKVLQRAPYVDIVLGAQNIRRLPELIEQIRQQKKPIIEVTDNRNYNFGSIDEPASEGMAIRQDQAKAWITIVEGCDNFCSYCVVPYARGKEHSRNHEEIVAEARKLINNGCLEITLLGQNVNSYGKGTDFNLPFLLHKLNQIENLKRIRFVTSNPRDFCDNLIKSIGCLEKVCEHIHLPVQSGSDRILHLMNRKYTVEEYLSQINKLKQSIPGVAISTDFIVGFPGETEKDFQETLDLVEKVRFDNFYPFIYCDRPKTNAVNLPGRVSKETAKARFNRLLEIQKKISKETALGLIGKTEEILVEGTSRNNPNYFSGRTRTNRLVHFKGSPEIVGQLKSVRIEEALENSFRGVIT